MKIKNFKLHFTTIKYLGRYNSNKTNRDSP